MKSFRSSHCLVLFFLLFINDTARTNNVELHHLPAHQLLLSLEAAQKSLTTLPDGPVKPALKNHCTALAHQAGELLGSSAWEQLAPEIAKAFKSPSSEFSTIITAVLATYNVQPTERNHLLFTLLLYTSTLRYLKNQAIGRAPITETLIDALQRDFFTQSCTVLQAPSVFTPKKSWSRARKIFWGAVAAAAILTLGNYLYGTHQELQRMKADMLTARESLQEQQNALAGIGQNIKDGLETLKGAFVVPTLDAQHRLATIEATQRDVHAELRAAAASATAAQASHEEAMATRIHELESSLREALAVESTARAAKIAEVTATLDTLEATVAREKGAREARDSEVAEALSSLRSSQGDMRTFIEAMDREIQATMKSVTHSDEVAAERHKLVARQITAVHNEIVALEKGPVAHLEADHRLVIPVVNCLSSAVFQLRRRFIANMNQIQAALNYWRSGHYSFSSTAIDEERQEVEALFKSFNEGRAVLIPARPTSSGTFDMVYMAYTYLQHLCNASTSQGPHVAPCYTTPPALKAYDASVSAPLPAPTDYIPVPMAERFRTAAYSQRSCTLLRIEWVNPDGTKIPLEAKPPLLTYIEPPAAAAAGAGKVAK